MDLVTITHDEKAFDFESHPEEFVGSCRGCEVNSKNISCVALPGCNQKIWKLAVPSVASAAKGPYHDAWMAQRRAVQETPKFPTLGWGGPVTQVTNLQYMLRDMRKLGSLKTLPDAICEALRRFGLPIDWHKLALEFPSVSGDSISYIGSERAMQQYIDGHPLKRITTKMGRYLTRHWPNAEPHEIRDIVMLYGEGVVEMQHTMSEMIYAVQNGPYSCMQWPGGDECNYRGEDDDEYETDIHPYEVYDPELGWAMVVFKEQGRISGRTLVHRPTKTFARSYGKESEGYSGSCAKSEAWLTAQGYKLVDAWPEGVRMLAIESDYRDGYVVPYLDPGQARRAENGNRCKLVKEDGKTYFERDNGGEYVFDNTDGTVSIDKIERAACSCCGAETGTYQLHRVYDPIQETQKLVCPSCMLANGYRYAEISLYNAEYIEGQYAMDDPATGRWFLKSAVDSGHLVKTITGEWQWKASCVPTKTGEWVYKLEVSSYESHKPYRYMDGYAVPRDEVVDCIMTYKPIYKTEAVQLTPVAWVKASNFEAFVSVQTKAMIARYLPEIQPRCMEVWEAGNKSAETDTPAASAVDSAQKLERLAVSFGASATVIGSAFRRAVETSFGVSGALSRPLRPAVVPFAVRGHQVPSLQALEDAVLSGQITSSN